MIRKTEFLNAGAAARRLGVSAKALRLYETHGLLAPDRSRAGWRCYGPDEMNRAAEIVALRRLGLGLSAIAGMLGNESTSRETALAQHQSQLESQARQLAATIRAVRHERHGQPGTISATPAVTFDLPWPWGGEQFVLSELRPLTYITGPLGSGKTRLAKRLAEMLPTACFLGLDRFDEDGTSRLARLDSNADPPQRCEQVLHALEDCGATPSSALTMLVIALCSDETGALVVDMVEQGLDRATQQVLIGFLRQRDLAAPPLFLMTRSSAILDLDAMASGETIIYCPANHSPPLIVHPDPTCPGYEAVETCIATPEVRARTTGVTATWAAGAMPPIGDSRETIS